MRIFDVIKEVLTPGKPEFKAQLHLLKSREADLIKCLQMLDNPATQEVTAATDEAAEFH